MATRSALDQPSTAHRPAAVILTRTTSIVLSPAFTISCRAVASSTRTRPASVRRVKPRGGTSAPRGPQRPAGGKLGGPRAPLCPPPAPPPPPPSPPQPQE